MFFKDGLHYQVVENPCHSHSAAVPAKSRDRKESAVFRLQRSLKSSRSPNGQRNRFFNKL
jgi:hypothetical protein